MAEKIISPGVFTSEIDQSFLPAAIGEIGAVVIGPTVKGPALVPTVVSSFSEFQEKFGTTFKSGSAYYTYLTSTTAQNYLKNSGRLTVVRTLAGTYSAATASITTDNTTPDQGASGSITFTNNATGSFGVQESGLAGNDEIGIGDTDFVFVSSSAGLVNSSTQIFVPFGSTVEGNAQTAGNIDLTGQNLRDAINNSSSLHNLNISASYEDSTNILAMTASLSGSAYNYNISVTSGSTGAFATHVDFEGGTDTTTSETVFKLHTLSHGTTMNNTGTVGTNNTLTNGTKDNVRYEISTKNNDKGTFTLLVRAGNDTVKRKQVLETWNNLSLDPNSKNYMAKMIGDQDLQFKSDDGYYIKPVGDYPNKSKYIRVEIVKQTVDYLDENGKVRVPAASASLPAEGSGSNGGSLGGGTDGDEASHTHNFYENITTAANTQGLNLGTGQTGTVAYTNALNLISNQDEYDVNMVLIPGIMQGVGGGHSQIINKAIDVCEDRGDAFTVVDPVSYGSTISSATSNASEYDSNYAAMYWPWVQVPENELGKNVWVPPSVVIPGIYAFNDKVAHPWFAPAGLNRGGIDTAVQAERKLTQGNRDTLYDSTVNPIATFPGQGVCVWGQKTLQKKSSALDRVNVRRLMIAVKKFIASSSRFLVFEQNTPATRRKFLNVVNPYLEQVQANSGLSAFKVVMDDTNNTPDVVDRNILYGQLFLQPTRTAEFVVLDFTVQPTGATFPE